MKLSQDDIDDMRAVADVSRETLERMAAHAELLRKWTRRINLVSPSTIPHMWRRHFIDSAQLFDLAPAGARTWLDLGAGAGFPGLVIAAIAAERAPALRATLVESDARKGAFLAAAAREIGVDAEIVVARAEDLGPRAFDVVSARALAPLSRLLALAEPFAEEGAACLFPKGETAARELTDARRCWHIRAIEHRSRTDRRSVILEIGEFRRARAPTD